MQANIKTQPHDCFDPVYDGTFEAPIDTEYNLPDYCADIQKLLKCQATPEIASFVVADDTLSCDGVCDIRVLYLDAKGDRIRCAEFTKEFTASVRLKSTQEKAVAWVQASIERAACRAVSARRLDLHITVSLRALAVAQRQELITADMEDDGIEKLKSGYRAFQAVNALSHQFTLEDTLTLKNGKPPIEAILRKGASCRVGDCRPGDGQLTVNGSVEIAFLYLSAVDDGGVERMSASLDFSQVIDCAGADGDCICDLKASIGECSIQPKEDDVGEYTVAELLVKVFLAAFLYKPCEVEIIDDAYSVKTPLTLRYGQTSLITAQDTHSEVLKKKCILPAAEEGIEKLLDIWCEQDKVQSTCDKGKLNYRVRFTVCMLYAAAGGRILYTEKAFDYTASTDMDDDLPRKSDTLSRTDIWEYRIADKGTVELSVETAVTTFLSAKTPVQYITAAESDPNAQPYPAGARLLVYYAAQGEKVWEIAKKHRTLLADLRTQNELYEDAVPEARPIILLNRSAI